MLRCVAAEDGEKRGGGVQGCWGAPLMSPWRRMIPGSNLIPIPMQERERPERGFAAELCSQSRSQPFLIPFFLDLRQLPNSCTAKSRLGLPGNLASNKYVLFLYPQHSQEGCYSAGDDDGMELRPSRGCDPIHPRAAAGSLPWVLPRGGCSVLWHHPPFIIAFYKA